MLTHCRLSFVLKKNNTMKNLKKMKKKLCLSSFFANGTSPTPPSQGGCLASTLSETNRFALNNIKKRNQKS